MCSVHVKMYKAAKADSIEDVRNYARCIGALSADGVAPVISMICSRLCASKYRHGLQKPTLEETRQAYTALMILKDLLVALRINKPFKITEHMLIAVTRSWADVRFWMGFLTLLSRTT